MFQKLKNDIEIYQDTLIFMFMKILHPVLANDGIEMDISKVSRKKNQKKCYLH